MSSEIKLTRGKVAIVDDEDLPLLLPHNWTAVRRGVKWYAQAFINKKYVLMHSFLLQHSEGTTDHINHNGLDNRRENIRPATYSQNALNNRCRGVRQQPNGRWIARITLGRKETSKAFDTEQEALEWRKAVVATFLS
jgi:hypothetical protein